MRIHLIDDDIELFELLRDYFRNIYELSASNSPGEALRLFRDHKPDLVILDLMLPEMNGLEVCKILRKDYPLLPIIILTAKQDSFDKIIGLELGADDYIFKPFNPRELQARIKSLLRRLEITPLIPENSKTKNRVIYSEAWDIRLDPEKRTVTCNNDLLNLTVMEYELLKSLMLNAGITQTREALINKIKGFEGDVTDRLIDVYIRRLRKKLSDNAKNPRIIKTIWGVGYVFSR